MFLNIIMLSTYFKITLLDPSCSLDLVTKLLSTQGFFLKISKDNNMVLNTKLQRNHSYLWIISMEKFSFSTRKPQNILVMK